MRYLLDTHVLLWAAYRDELLSPHGRRALSGSGNELFVSAASAWEIATKHRLGKLPDAQILAENFVATVTEAGYLLLPIAVEHALRAGRMSGTHKDPFDRMLAAQAIDEDMPILSSDPLLDGFGARRIW
ncbi:MAG TPA: type II toxin-antitoxin system VapC family toxin [Terracidiphilus sp.]|nr:type II toxin-antitoxin system VapC family toxin [Terracidiphilus sp.]